MIPVYALRIKSLAAPEETPILVLQSAFSFARIVCYVAVAVITGTVAATVASIILSALELYVTLISIKLFASRCE